MTDVESHVSTGRHRWQADRLQSPVTLSHDIKTPPISRVKYDVPLKFAIIFLSILVQLLAICVSLLETFCLSL